MSDKANTNDAVTPAPLGEIEHGPSKFEEFLEKNFKLILLGALLVIVAVAAFVITGQLSDAKAQEAGNALLAAQDPEALRAVSKDFPESAASASAQMLLADQLWNEGKEQEAQETLESVIAAGDDSPAASYAKFALATIFLKKGETEKARSQFESVLSDSSATALHPLTLISLGDIAKAAGDEEKARAYYDQKLEKYKTFGDQGLAVARLNMVGVDMPQKVSPPPPAPEPNPSDLNPSQDPASFLSPQGAPAIDLSTPPAPADPVQIPTETSEETSPEEAEEVQEAVPAEETGTPLVREAEEEPSAEEPAPESAE